MPNQPRGRGVYTGGYPVIEGDVSRQLTAAEQIAENISGIFTDYRNRKFQELQILLEGVKQGLVDPNEALVQGTPGGELYKKFFRSEPPVKPYEETIRGQREITVPATPLQEGRGEEPFTTAFTPTETKVKKGGFLPQNVNQLKDFVARKLARGEEVSPILLKASGLTPKKDYEEEKVLAAVRNEPKRMANYLKAKQIYGDNVPDEVIRQIAFGDITAAPEIKGQTVAQEKTRKIGAFKEKELTTRIEIARESLAQKDRKLDAEDERALAKTRGELITKISNVVGYDQVGYAAELADKILSGEDVGGVPESVMKRVQAEIGRKERVVATKELVARATAAEKTAKPEQRQAEFDAKVQYWNALLELQFRRIQDTGTRDAITKNLRLAAEKLKNPNTRAEGEELLNEIAEKQLGFTFGDLTGFQAFKESVGMLIFGTPGYGKPPLKPAETPAQVPPFNPPKVVPRQTAPIKPKNAQEFLNKYKAP